MRAGWIPSALAGLALGASCLLPPANVDYGTETGGGTSGGFTGSSSSGPRPPTHEIGILPSAPDLAVAPSGNPGQRHLVHAGGAWWAFYPTVDHVGVRTSPDFHAWMDNPTVAGTSATLAYGFTLGTYPNGTVFGIDTQTTGGNDVVHVSLSGPASSAPVEAHARAVVIPAQPHAHLAFDTPAAVPVPGLKSAAPGVDGTVTAIALDASSIVDLASLGGVGGSCALVSTQGDDGKTWTEGFAAPSKLDVPLTGIVVGIRGALALKDTVVALWPSQTGLFAAHGSGQTWSAGQKITPEVSGDTSRRWAGCVQPEIPNVRPATGHVLAWGPVTRYTHVTTTDGQSWAMAPAPLPRSIGASLDELFLSCGQDRVFAFTVNPASDHPILGAVWTTTTGWGEWFIAVAETNTGLNRCFLTGYDRVVDGMGTGLMWTVSPQCDSLAQPTLYGAIVPPDAR